MFYLDHCSRRLAAHQHSKLDLHGVTGNEKRNTNLTPLFHEKNLAVKGRLFDRVVQNDLNNSWNISKRCLKIFLIKYKPLHIPVS